MPREVSTNAQQLIDALRRMSPEDRLEIIEHLRDEFGLDRAGDDKRLLRPQQAAALLGLAEKTLRNWRVRGEGPCYRKLGRVVRYQKGELLDWAAAQSRRSTSE